MEIDRKELKRLTREAMGLPSPRFWVVTLVYLLLTTGVSYAVSYLVPLPAQGFSAFALFLSLLTALYTTVLQFGYDLWSLWTSRRLGPGLGALIQSFEIAGRVILMRLLLLVRLFGWCLLLSLLVAGAFTIFPFLLPLLIPGISAFLWVIMLRYALANYLLADRPDDGPSAALQRSVYLMRGWKMELFKLELSFLGWELINLALQGLVLAVLLSRTGFYQAVAAMNYENIFQIFDTVSTGALAVGLSNLVTLPLSLWLTPYRSVTRAGFYEARLRLQRESAPQMPPL